MSASHVPVEKAPQGNYHCLVAVLVEETLLVPAVPETTKYPIFMVTAEFFAVKDR